MSNIMEQLKEGRRDVPVRRLILTSNPDCEESAEDCISMIESFNKYPETKGLHVDLYTAKIVEAGEDTLVIRKGNILLEIEYIDKATTYMILERSEGVEPSLPEGEP